MSTEFGLGPSLQMLDITVLRNKIEGQKKGNPY